jgi:transcriptional regulator with PAS, ATPase and Fis domain
MRKQAGIIKKPFPDISEASMKILLNYRYPGNIRELENIIEHAIILCQEDVISPCHLPAYLLDRSSSQSDSPDKEMENSETALERQRILDVLVSNSWHRKKTALVLNMDRTTLWRKMRKYGIAE